MLEFKFTILTPWTLLSPNLSDDECVDEAADEFARVLCDRTLMEFDRYSFWPRARGEAFITTSFDNFEQRYLRQSEYAVIVLSGRHTSCLDNIYPRFLVFLTRRPSWTERLLLVFLGPPQSQFRFDTSILTHQPIVFNGSMEDAWYNDGDSWTKLLGVLQRNYWSPSMENSRIQSRSHTPMSGDPNWVSVTDLRGRPLAVRITSSMSQLDAKPLSWQNLSQSDRDICTNHHRPCLANSGHSQFNQSGTRVTAMGTRNRTVSWGTFESLHGRSSSVPPVPNELASSLTTHGFIDQSQPHSAPFSPYIRRSESKVQSAIKEQEEEQGLYPVESENETNQGSQLPSAENEEHMCLPKTAFCIRRHGPSHETDNIHTHSQPSAPLAGPSTSGSRTSFGRFGERKRLVKSSHDIRNDATEETESKQVFRSLKKRAKQFLKLNRSETFGSRSKNALGETLKSLAGFSTGILATDPGLDLESPQGIEAHSCPNIQNVQTEQSHSLSPVSFNYLSDNYPESINAVSLFYPDPVTNIRSNVRVLVDDYSSHKSKESTDADRIFQPCTTCTQTDLSAAYTTGVTSLSNLSTVRPDSGRGSMSPLPTETSGETGSRTWMTSTGPSSPYTNRMGLHEDSENYMSSSDQWNASECPTSQITSVTIAAPMGPLNLKSDPQFLPSGAFEYNRPQLEMEAIGGVKSSNITEPGDPNTIQVNTLPCLEARLNEDVKEDGVTAVVKTYPSDTSQVQLTMDKESNTLQPLYEYGEKTQDDALFSQHEPPSTAIPVHAVEQAKSNDALITSTVIVLEPPVDDATKQGQVYCQQPFETDLDANFDDSTLFPSTIQQSIDVMYHESPPSKETVERHGLSINPYEAWMDAEGSLAGVPDICSMVTSAEQKLINSVDLSSDMISDISSDWNEMRAENKLMTPVIDIMSLEADPNAQHSELNPEPQKVAEVSEADSGVDAEFTGTLNLIPNLCEIVVEPESSQSVAIMEKSIIVGSVPSSEHLDVIGSNEGQHHDNLGIDAGSSDMSSNVDSLQATKSVTDATVKQNECKVTAASVPGIQFSSEEFVSTDGAQQIGSRLVQTPDETFGTVLEPTLEYPTVRQELPPEHHYKNTCPTEASKNPTLNNAREYLMHANSPNPGSSDTKPATEHQSSLKLFNQTGVGDYNPDSSKILSNSKPIKSEVGNVPEDEINLPLTSREFVDEQQKINTSGEQICSVQTTNPEFEPSEVVPEVNSLPDAVCAEMQDPILLEQSAVSVFDADKHQIHGALNDGKMNAHTTVKQVTFDDQPYLLVSDRTEDVDLELCKTENHALHELKSDRYDFTPANHKDEEQDMNDNLLLQSSHKPKCLHESELTDECKASSGNATVEARQSSTTSSWSSWLSGKIFGRTAAASHKENDPDGFQLTAQEHMLSSTVTEDPASESVSFHHPSALLITEGDHVLESEPKAEPDDESVDKLHPVPEDLNSNEISHCDTSIKNNPCDSRKEIWIEPDLITVNKTPSLTQSYPSMNSDETEIMQHAKTPEERALEVVQNETNPGTETNEQQNLSTNCDLITPLRTGAQGLVFITSDSRLNQPKDTVYGDEPSKSNITDDLDVKGEPSTSIMGTNDKSQETTDPMEPHNSIAVTNDPESGFDLYQTNSLTISTAAVPHAIQFGEKQPSEPTGERLQTVQFVLNDSVPLSSSSIVSDLGDEETRTHDNSNGHLMASHRPSEWCFVVVTSIFHFVTIYIPRHAYWFYSATFGSRERLFEAMSERGIRLALTWERIEPGFRSPYCVAVIFVCITSAAPHIRQWPVLLERLFNLGEWFLFTPPFWVDRPILYHLGHLFHSVHRGLQWHGQTVITSFRHYPWSLVNPSNQ